MHVLGISSSNLSNLVHTSTYVYIQLVTYILDTGILICPVCCV